jgi:hypothetical protein
LLIVTIFFLATISCLLTSQAGEIQQESQTIDLDGAQDVGVSLRMGAGDLSIQGGSQTLLDAVFTYNVEDRKPIVDYSVSGDRGSLSIEQPDVKNLSIEDYRYEWNLRFTQDVPIDLDVILGAGSGKLNFSQISLTNLDLEVGAGDMEIDLTGGREVDLDGNIRGGVGKLTILLPNEVGVIVNINGGLGNINTNGLTLTGDRYVNDSYGDTSVTIRLVIEGGIGEIELRVGNE